MKSLLSFLKLKVKLLILNLITEPIINSTEINNDSSRSNIKENISSVKPTVASDQEDDLIVADDDAMAINEKLESKEDEVTKIQLKNDDIKISVPTNETIEGHLDKLKQKIEEVINGLHYNEENRNAEVHFENVHSGNGNLRMRYFSQEQAKLVNPIVQNTIRDFHEDRKKEDERLQKLIRYVNFHYNNKNKIAVTDSNRDYLFNDCARTVVQMQSGSTANLQRRMNLGYNRAGRIIDQLEAAGVVGPSVSGIRDVYIKNVSDLEQFIESGSLFYEKFYEDNKKEIDDLKGIWEIVFNTNKQKEEGESILFIQTD